MRLHTALKPYIHIKLNQRILVNVYIYVGPEIIAVIALAKPVVWIGIAILEKAFLVGCSKHDEIPGRIATTRSGKVDALLHGRLVEYCSIPVYIWILVWIAAAFVSIKMRLCVQLRNPIIG